MKRYVRGPESEQVKKQKAAVYKIKQKKIEEKRTARNYGCRKGLENAGYTIKEFSIKHWRVAEVDFWPYSGTYYHIETKKRGSGLKNFIEYLDCLKVEKFDPVETLVDLAQLTKEPEVNLCKHYVWNQAALKFDLVT